MPDFSFLARGVQAPELPDPFKMAMQGLTMSQMADSNTIRKLAIAAKERENAAQDEFTQLYGPLVQAGFSNDAVAQASGKARYAGPLIEKAREQYLKSLDDTRKADATVFKDQTTKEIEMFANMAGGLSKRVREGTANPQWINSFMMKIADRGLGKYIPAPPMGSTMSADPNAMADYLENLSNAFYKTSDRIKNEETGRHNVATEGIQTGQLNESMRHNKGMEGLTARGQNMTDARARELAQMTNERMLEQNRIALDSKNEARVDRETQGITKLVDSQSLPGLSSSMRNLNTILEQYSTQKDIPGVGVVTGAMPSLLLSQEGKKIRSAIQGVTNDLLKLYSGGAVTLSESQRRTIEMMAGGGFNENDLYTAWPMIVGRYNEAIKNIEGGFSPQAVDTYKQRSGSNILSPITPAERKVGQSNSAVDAVMKKLGY